MQPTNKQLISALTHLITEADAVIENAVGAKAKLKIRADEARELIRKKTTPK